MPQDCVAIMRKAFEERRDVLVRGLNAIPGISCRKPEGAFYVMMNIQGVLGTSFEGRRLSTCDDFADALLTHAKVATVPGTAFLAEGFCRLSYAASMENIQEGLRRIDAFVRALK